MKIHARNGSGRRELLLGQPVQPSDGFQCPFSVPHSRSSPRPPGVMVAQATLVTGLAQLDSMTGDHDAMLDAAATARARTPARSNTRSAALISSRGPVIASNPDLGSKPRSGVVACPPAPFPRGQAAD